MVLMDFDIEWQTKPSITDLYVLLFVSVLTIYGPADPVNPPPFDEHYRTVIPNPDLVVLGDNIGHYPQWEAPKDVTKYYARFLSKHRKKSKV